MTTLPTSILAGDRPAGPDFAAILAALGPVPIYKDRIVTSGVVGSVAFTSIPSTLRRVRVHWTVRGDTAAQAVSVFFQAGGDTGANYNYTQTQTQNGTVTATSAHASTSAYLGLALAASATATWFGSGEFTLNAWDNSNSGVMGYRFNSEAMGTAIANHFAVTGGGNYAGANARTSITLSPGVGSFIAGCVFDLEGW